MSDYDGDECLALEDDSETRDYLEIIGSDRNVDLRGLDEEQLHELTEYLQVRLDKGMNQRQARMPRMLRVDRVISTWQEHTGEDAKRLKHEERTGEQTAVTSNLPVMAAHLEDLTAFFAEVLAPISNPYVTTGNDEAVIAVVKRLIEDVAPRGYYSRITRSVRAMLKYNLGGVVVEWDAGTVTGYSTNGVKNPGNDYHTACPYNTAWDPIVTDPTQVHSTAEWGYYVKPISRIGLIRNVAKGIWLPVDDTFGEEDKHAGREMSELAERKLWFDPARAIPTADGSDAVGELNTMTPTDWANIGLSLPGESLNGGEEDVIEHTVMYCWIRPAKFGLLSDEGEDQIRSAGQDKTTYLELWRFDIINGNEIVAAAPHSPRDRFLTGEPAVIPIFMSHMLQDDTLGSQRSTMELIVPFQRLASSMYSIGVKALRRGIFGVTVFDPTMIDAGQAENASHSAVASVAMKKSGDAGKALNNFTSSTGAAEAFKYTDMALALKAQLFPSQSLPSQVAGLDRAVSNQVTALVHGAQSGLRMALRLVNEGVFTPARMEATRNLQRYENTTAQDVSDEAVAKQFGSGVDALESERIVEAVWRLLMAIVQNKEASETFDVPSILGFLGRTMRVNVDMSDFARQQPTAAPQTAPTPEEQMLAAAQGAQQQ